MFGMSDAMAQYNFIWWYRRKTSECLLFAFACSTGLVLVTCARTIYDFIAFGDRRDQIISNSC